MGHSRHCSEEQRTLIKTLIGEGKTYKEVQKIIDCSAKMIANFPVSTLSAKSPRKVPLLKKRHVLKRFQFAKEQIDWPKEKRRNILWTVLFGSRGPRQFVK
uniref:Transposase IS30-like HTH domain-containing protein n=1 Tax=Paramormyrops kingsleyae TaxID=1676925 RepID=A0A3B3QFF6_9TELE